MGDNEWPNDLHNSVFFHAYGHYGVGESELLLVSTRRLRHGHDRVRYRHFQHMIELVQLTTCTTIDLCFTTSSFHTGRDEDARLTLNM